MPVVGVHRYELSQPQKEQLELRASQGDPEALHRLALYHEMILLDQDKSTALLRDAAQRGHLKSQTRLGVILLRAGTAEQREEGLSLLRKAAAAGDQHAADVLESESR